MRRTVLVTKAMIMAAGVGSRLDPLTQKIPKPMIPIANRPIMELLLEHLHNFGITHVIANTHHLAESIHEKFDNYNMGIDLNYIHEDKLSGTAGGVKKCEYFFANEKTFVVISGDALTDVNIKELVNKHKETGAIATMALKKIPKSEVNHFGVVVIDANEKIIGFQEKPTIEEAKSNLVNTGIYVFETEIFKYIPENTFFDFAKNVFPVLMANNEPLYAHIIEEYWSDIGTFNQYKQASFDILNNKVNIHDPCSDPSLNFYTEKCIQQAKLNKILVGKNSIVDASVKFKGDCIIGSNCIIQENVEIIDSIIWDNVTIEKGSKLDNCIISNNVKIGYNSIITPDCIIADSCTIKSNQKILETIKG